jgi:hypothetical protein
MENDEPAIDLGALPPSLRGPRCFGAEERPDGAAWLLFEEPAPTRAQPERVKHTKGHELDRGVWVSRSSAQVRGRGGLDITSPRGST